MKKLVSLALAACLLLSLAGCDSRDKAQITYGKEMAADSSAPAAGRHRASS